MRILGLTICAVLCMSALLLLNYAFEKRPLNTHLDRSIVRLHTKDGRFFCSGTVISPTQIATAAHCVSIETPFGIIVDEDAQIEIRAQDGIPTGIYAHIGGINGRLDSAMLVGNFNLFDTRPIETDPGTIDAILMNPKSHIAACGYPLGGPLTCSSMTKIHHYLFQYAGLGWLYPGMSGGPVIDLDTGKILAVNRAVDESQIIVSPLVDFLFDMSRG